MTKTLDGYMALHYPVKLIERDTGRYFATHPDLQGCMAEGATADEAVCNLRNSREVWIEARLNAGYGVPEPAAEDEYSGKLLLRMSPRLHAGLAAAAANQNVSLNQLITGVLSEYLGGVRLEDRFSVNLRGLQEGVAAEISTLLRGIQAVVDRPGNSSQQVPPARRQRPSAASPARSASRPTT
jgi:antitoxin HicB